MSALSTPASDLPYVDAPLGYLSPDAAEACYRVWPPSSGREPESPSKTYYTCRIADCRPVASALSLEGDGFVFRQHSSAFTAYFDEERVKAEYYPEMEAYLKALTGASAVFIFDHNVRSASRAAKGEKGVRAPVDIVHGDYTEPSGERRAREILAARGYDGPAPRRTWMVNAWRPMHGPIVDLPLTLCQASSVAPEDLVRTPIYHYMEDRLAAPSHTGEIFSVRHSPAHRWFYASRMHPGELLAFKNYDSDASSRTRCTPHTGFAHPDRPADFRPRESIEVRAVVLDPDPARRA